MNFYIAFRRLYFQEHNSSKSPKSERIILLSILRVACSIQGRHKKPGGTPGFLMEIW